MPKNKGEALGLPGAGGGIKVVWEGWEGWDEGNTGGQPFPCVLWRCGAVCVYLCIYLFNYLYLLVYLPSFGYLSTMIDLLIYLDLFTNLPVANLPLYPFTFTFSNYLFTYPSLCVFAYL